MNKKQVEWESSGTMSEEELGRLMRQAGVYGQMISQNKWDGEDLAQEAVLKAWSRYPAGKISLALVNRIAKNAWVDTVRQKKYDLPGALPETAAREEAGTAGELIEELTGRLTPKQTLIFLLAEAFAFKNKETARVTGLTETAVKALRLRGAGRLKCSQVQKHIALWPSELEEEAVPLFTEAVRTGDPHIMAPVIRKVFRTEPTLSLSARVHLLSPNPGGSLSNAA
ncbi:hypothetical protein CR205_01700 [Alteribacter lacisalsi]|uniref:RNA polymerase sigma factor 70 region 4 type 2 domain-containing protein n=1 Tax=Alteribacter lacisalsi TaxID=2045244 RepID=A0A2W0H648_9BACI|nr:sigma factor-like helix-turn-helix DNA-binding protein [Alteribacter lacisalsi]PYZ97343.1 hypothetical protein CR205_01700 [Alteribacter lacisalsi]